MELITLLPDGLRWELDGWDQKSHLDELWARTMAECGEPAEGDEPGCPVLDDDVIAHIAHCGRFALRSLRSK